MMQLIYYLVYYLITGILTLNPLGIELNHRNLDGSMTMVQQESVCQSFTTFINQNSLLG